MNEPAMAQEIVTITIHTSNGEIKEKMRMVRSLWSTKGLKQTREDLEEAAGFDPKQKGENHDRG